ncbi:MAG TPA: sugar fermentation stimulation protein [Candidatus Magasanikbacteria bacterium]|nr:sugar fermentation stimulation protein [Candidatus Magasanikbacteria bacterium]
MVKHPKLFLIITIGLGLLASLLICWQWVETSTTQSLADLNLNKVEIVERVKSKTIIVKGLYLTAYSAGNPKKMDEIIKLIDKTELNAVVIDVKDYSGKVLYDSNLLWIKEFKTKENRLGDVKALIKKLHEHNIYVIARQTVFQDPLLASKKSEWAIKSSASSADGLWRDHKGLAWVDPTRIEVWNYNVAIAKEAIRFGFDEINFDYVRFPSDGNMKLVIYNTGNEPKYEVMRRFYTYLRNKLNKESAWISLDMFGYVMERTDDMNIGQRLVDAVDNTDYICPMMYPSHYSKNSLGYENPAEIPGLIIDNGMKKGLPIFENKRAKVRPWLQAFDIGAKYSDGPKIREQIDAVEKYDNAGWLLWNAANRYSVNGLLVE